MGEIKISYSHYPRNIGQYCSTALNLLLCSILLTCGIIVLNKSSSMGFDVIPKELGVYPIILMIYVVIITIICVYNGEAISSRIIPLNFLFVSFMPSVIIVMIMLIYAAATSAVVITDEKINNTISLCCPNFTYSSKCNFMEKYGCDSFNITKSQFDEATYNSYFMIFVFMIVFTPTTTVYLDFTRKMLESEGKISEEENSIQCQLGTPKKESIIEKLKKNPDVYESNIFVTRDISVYYKRLHIVTGILSVYYYILYMILNISLYILFISIICVGWNICELVYTNKIGFNLFSKDLNIIKLVYWIILFIYSVNVKRIFSKCHENKKKGYRNYVQIIQLIIFVTGLYFFIRSIATHDISNYSETYENCCINHVVSNKCDFLKESACNSIDEYLNVIPKKTIFNYGYFVNFFLFFIYFGAHVFGSIFEYTTIEEERKKRTKFEKQLIKLGYEDLVKEYRPDSSVFNN